MPKGRNNHVTASLEPFIAAFYRLHGRKPTVKECMAGLPHLEQNRDAIEKALPKIMARVEKSVVPEVSKEPKKDPALAAREAMALGTPLGRQVADGDLADRLMVTKLALAGLHDRAAAGVVDAMGIEKLETLVWKMEEKIREDAEAAKRAAGGAEPPVWSALLADYEDRCRRGLAKPTTRGVVTDGISGLED